MVKYCEEDVQFGLGALYALAPALFHRVTQKHTPPLELNDRSRSAYAGGWMPSLVLGGDHRKPYSESAGDMARLVVFVADVLQLHWRQRLSLAARASQKLSLRSAEAVQLFWCRMAQETVGRKFQRDRRRTTAMRGLGGLLER